MAKKSKPLIVTEVEHDFKTYGEPQTHKLGQVTCIWGRSGTGKTALLNAIEAALTATISDYDGRVETKDVGRLGTLGTFAHAKLSNGVKCTYDLQPKRLHRNAFPDAFPLRGLRTALLGAPDTVRKYLLGRIVPSTVTREDIAKRYVDPAQGAQFIELTEDRPGRPPDLLLDLIAKSAKKVRSLTAQSGDFEEYANRRAEGLAPEPNEADIAALEAAMQTAIAEAAAQHAPSVTLGPLPDLTELETRAVAAATAFKEARAALAAREEEVGEIPKDLSARIARFEHLAYVAHFHARGTAPRDDQPARRADCLTCGQDAGHEDFERQDEAAQARLKAVQDQIPAWAELDSARSQLAQLKATAEAAVDAYEEGYELVKKATAQDHATVAEPDRNPAQRVDALREKLRQAHRAVEGWEAVRDFQHKAAQAKATAVALSALHKASLAVMTSVLDSAVDDFKSRVQRYLPDEPGPRGDGYIFELRLRDEQGAPLFELGFLRTDPHGQQAVHVARGGAEQAHLHLALGCALAELDREAGRLADDDPVVLVPEDRGIDSETLRDSLQAIRAGIDAANLPVQVIWLSVNKPAGRKLKGCTYICTNPPKSATASRQRRSPASAASNADEGEKDAEKKATEKKGRKRKKSIDNGSGQLPLSGEAR